MKGKGQKYLSKEAAIENAKKFFSSNSEDVISIQDAFAAWGRDLSNEEKNKSWFSNKLVDLKYHDLVKPIYSMQNNRRVLTKIQLTLEGKRVIGRIGEIEQSINSERQFEQSNDHSISLEDIMKIIPKLRKENPEFNITFSVTPKER